MEEVVDDEGVVVWCSEEEEGREVLYITAEELGPLITCYNGLM